ncbi:hypothetical protein [Rubrivivax gelatinosus]|uniref:hypothetical protein n=1 Tax=Rubrivivax gelatinosus TaxID=28068 RepID=UPI0002DD66CF|nr:hypothetical protein [Rubrivivax gelatinosus]MBG6083135.1 hypothetical protein [Rubrivivax gelatinosus]
MPRSLQSAATKLLVAAINCAHTITDEQIVLHFDKCNPGRNALNQLGLRLESFLASMSQGTTGMRWMPIRNAPKDGSVILVDDNSEGSAPWAAARWLPGEDWAGWIYADEGMNDCQPLGPNPTRWLQGLDECFLLQEGKRVDVCEAVQGASAFEVSSSERSGPGGAEWEPRFERWWQDHGQFVRSGGGAYEKAFACRAYEAALASVGGRRSDAGGTRSTATDAGPSLAAAVRQLLAAQASEGAATGAFVLKPETRDHQRRVLLAWRAVHDALQAETAAGAVPLPSFHAAACAVVAAYDRQALTSEHIGLLRAQCDRFVERVQDLQTGPMSACEDAVARIVQEKIAGMTPGEVASFLQARATLSTIVQVLQLPPVASDLVQRFAGEIGRKLATAVETQPDLEAWADVGGKERCRELLLQRLSAGDVAGVAACCALLWRHGPTVSLLPDAFGNAGKAADVLFLRIQRLAARHGVLWDRHQGKGWPEEAAEEFAKLRDVQLPAANVEFRAMCCAASVTQSAGATPAAVFKA